MPARGTTTRGCIDDGSHSIALHRIASHSIALHSIALHSIGSLGETCYFYSGDGGGGLVIKHFTNDVRRCHLL